MKMLSEVDRRWAEGVPHHVMSKNLMSHIMYVDFEDNGDYFCWKSGGDGDNGETLMYEMDSFFEKFEENLHRKWSDKKHEYDDCDGICGLCGLIESSENHIG